MKQKKKLKKKKKETDEILPTCHEKIGNVNVYSEEVSKWIIEKLISLTISKIFLKNTEKKINDICLAELIQKTNNLAEIYNINHEIDDFNNSEYIISKIKYLKTDNNEKRHKVNIHKKANNQRSYAANKALFEMANINKYEQKEMLIKNKEIKDFLNKSFVEKNNLDLIMVNNTQYDLEITKYNFWGDIAQPKSYDIDRTSSLFNNLKIDKNVPPDKLEKKEIKKTISIKQKFYYNYKPKVKIINEEEFSPKKKFQPILQMPFVELPQEENKNKETEDIIKIREETLLMQAKIDKLKKKEINQKNKNKENIIKGKFTTDVKGKIVLIKEILPENLLKEFSPITSQQKELLTGQSMENLRIDEALMEKKAKKKIIYNNGKGAIKPIINSILKSNKESEKDIKSSKNTSIKTPLSDEAINSNFFGFSNPFHRNEKIILAGSNFKIIKPSVGVNIKEKNMIKTGDNNYFKNFHKYSLDEFNKVLQETLSLEKEKLSGYFLTNNINPINKDNKKEEKKYEKFRKINNKYKMNNFRKTFSDNFRAKKEIKKSMSEVFTLRDNYNVLKEVLMHEDRYDFEQLKKLKKIEKNKSVNNIFERNIMTPNGRMSVNNKNKKEVNFNLIDDFNKDLMLGYYQSARGRNILPKLPPKKSVYLNFNNNINFMNSTMNNFYRTRQKRNTDFMESFSSNNIRNKKIKI